ncbi:ribokinase [Paenibacillus baekrokdamisoli]|uniref:Ribokinase n=1 Tax=Paenibacillus baekrokdamisoli TaxID=1712516 RepID=A0A3G9JI85_9BACL|nr:carbohydrate kinase family protein [Paenibacillus baekrokdamisoli]MBB3068957.1 sugar/nucleoside kinase (ribokinase family) [Paenibacillus baekrokdamisoli]BBH23778.1 ribokinase [Paenibacillus baekrokdamisoli]
MKPYDTIVIGDINIDLVVAGCNDLPAPGQEVLVQNMTLHVGGGAALFSLALAKLGLKIAFNGILGEDGFGQFVRDKLIESGIDTRFIRKSTMNNTGISIAINPEKDRSFITYMGSNSELNLQQLDMNSVILGRHVHLTGYRGSQNHKEYMEMTNRLKSLGLTTSLDVGWDDTGEWYKGIFELMKQVDVFFMNEVEAQHYTGCSSAEESIAELSRHCRHIVVKLGSEGAVAAVDGQLMYRSGFEIPVVDTTGAGDSFNAGYIYGFLTGEQTEQCLLFANACGAMSVSQSGGSTGTPDRAALEHFIAEKVGHTTDIWEAAG